MAYNSKILDHVYNPRNVGDMDPDDPEVGIGLVGAPACGDVMQFCIRIKENKVVEAKFKTFGCGSAIAASSLLTELIKDKNISEAEKIKNKDIYDELKLPPVKFHCSVLAEDAVKAAISDWRSKQTCSQSQA
jgi:Fe-S cluster assembly scaffold IscU